MFNDVGSTQQHRLAKDGEPHREWLSTVLLHHSGDLIRLFDDTFRHTYRTRLRGGAAEPLYEAAREQNDVHTIWFTRDYFASALHEVAHWCVAGIARRQQEDYGYWYAPDGRTGEQQAEFERVEVKPQALEWLFSRAAGWRFRPSADNLASGLGPSLDFCRAIEAQVQRYCQQGVNARVQAFLAALIQFYGTAPDVSALLRAVGGEAP